MTDTMTWDDRDWKSADEANKQWELLPQDAGYVLRVDWVSDPFVSPFEYKDDKGQPKPKDIQTKILFTVVHYEDPQFIGEWLYGFFPIKMHTKSNFYKFTKALFGGDVDPLWKPNKADLVGKIVAAVIDHKEPNAEGRIYPKVTQFLPYRGKQTFIDVPYNYPPNVDIPTVDQEVVGTETASDEAVPF